MEIDSEKKNSSFLYRIFLYRIKDGERGKENCALLTTRRGRCRERMAGREVKGGGGVSVNRSLPFSAPGQ